MDMRTRFVTALATACVIGQFGCGDSADDHSTGGASSTASGSTVTVTSSTASTGTGGQGGMPMPFTSEGASSYESQSGPTLGAVTFRSPDVFVHIAQSERGRVAGTVAYGRGNSAKLTTRTLRVPRSGSTLLSRGSLKVALHPGAKGFLTVQGLPAQTREVTVKLTTPAGRDLLAGRRTGKNRCRVRMAADITGTSRTLAVDGGVTSGLCRFGGS